MPFLAETHRFLSHTPLITAIGPVIFFLVTISAIYYLRLTRLLKMRLVSLQAAHHVTIKENITERKELLDRLDKMAHIDKLTELPNRNLFFDRLNFVIALSRRQNLRFALFYIDLDGFKNVNDTYGHDAGDIVLQEAARRFKLCVRESDTVSRMGGDEFTIILNHVNQINGANIVAEKIMKEFGLPFCMPGNTACKIGLSIGVSFYPDDTLISEHLLNAANTAMYAVKKSGKHDYRCAHDLLMHSLLKGREPDTEHNYLV